MAPPPGKIGLNHKNLQLQLWISQISRNQIKVINGFINFRTWQAVLKRHKYKTSNDRKVSTYRSDQIAITASIAKRWSDKGCVFSIASMSLVDLTPYPALSLDSETTSPSDPAGYKNSRWGKFKSRQSKLTIWWLFWLHILLNKVFDIVKISWYL